MIGVGHSSEDTERRLRGRVALGAKARQDVSTEARASLAGFRELSRTPTSVLERSSKSRLLSVLYVILSTPLLFVRALSCISLESCALFLFVSFS